jgi:pyridoxamine 5'-phosphate oxidase
MAETAESAARTTEELISRFEAWMEDAKASEPNDPNAVCLATCTPDGRPSARMVLLKGVDPRGFVFYTNLESRKGGELAANPHAALCFHWKTLARSVRVEGRVEPVSEEEADAYYASRARGSRIGAWASKQSRPLESRFALEKRVAEFGLKFAVGEIPRPAFWSGFRVIPERIEFWRDMPFRLHERLVYLRDGEGGPWRTEMLYP